jgi:hypothetical protein
VRGFGFWIGSGPITVRYQHKHNNQQSDQINWELNEFVPQIEEQKTTKTQQSAQIE